jgi:hypothetical protein
MSPPSRESPSSSPRQSLPSLSETEVPFRLPYHTPFPDTSPWQQPSERIQEEAGYVFRLDEPATTTVGGGNTPVSRSPSRSSRSSSPTGSASSSEDEYDDRSGSDFHSNSSSRRASVDHRRSIERRARERRSLALARLSNNLEGMGPLGANAATAMAVAAAGRTLIGAANMAGTRSGDNNLNPSPNTNPTPQVSTSTPTPAYTAATPNPHTGQPLSLPEGGGGGEANPSNAPAARTTNDGPPPMEAEPPPYHEPLKLIPMTSEQTSRYDRGPLP